MTQRRIEQLLEKELDGELSATEREELERLILIEPSLRRERAAWSRVSASIAPERAPAIELSRMTSKILNARSARLTVRRAWWPRLAFASTAAAALAVVVLATRHHEAPPAVARKPAVAEVVRAPVDVFVDENAAEEDRTALTEIRF